MATRCRFRSSLVGMLVLAAACGSTLVLGANDLDEAKQLYREGRFPESIAKLRMALVELPLLRDLEVRRVQLADAYLHLALAQMALVNQDSAKEAFKEMLRVDPQRKLDPEIYAPKVVGLLAEAQDELAREPKPPAADGTPAGRLKAGSHKGRNIALLVGAGVGAAGIGIAASRGPAAGQAPPVTTFSNAIFTPVTGNGQARIEWLTAVPPPGSTVSLSSRSCGGGLNATCTSALQLTFQVTPNADVESASLTVELLDGTRRCLQGFTIYRANLTAGVPFPMDVVQGWRVQCTPPFTTTNMTAFLRGPQGQTVALEGFAGGFSFLP